MDSPCLFGGLYAIGTSKLKNIQLFFVGVALSARPVNWAGKMPTPQDWIIYLLEIPY
jgi:hypothetical protein